MGWAVQFINSKRYLNGNLISKELRMEIAKCTKNSKMYKYWIIVFILQPREIADMEMKA